jgi:hypothetical protein
LELALSQEVYEYLEELDEMNWSARGNVLNQYLRNTSIGTTVMYTYFWMKIRFIIDLWGRMFRFLMRHVHFEYKNISLFCIVFSTVS